MKKNYLFILFVVFQYFAIGQNESDLCKEWKKTSITETNNAVLIDISNEYLKKVSDSCKVLILKDMSIVYNFSIKPDSAMIYIDKAIAMGIAQKNEEELADCYGHKGFLYIQENKLAIAKKNLDKAKSILRKYPNSLNWVGHYYHLENYYIKQDKTDLALKYADSALQKGIQLNDTSNIANLYQNLGVKYFQRNDYQSALKNLLKSLEIKESKDAPQLEGSYYTVGVCLYRLEDHKLAENYIQKAITTSEKNGNDYVKLLSNVMLAKQKRKEKEHEKALEYIEIAIPIATKLNSDFQIAETLREKGNIIHVGFNNLEKAKALYMEAYEFAQKSQKSISIKPAILALYDIHIALKNYPEAKKYLDKLEEIKNIDNNLSNLENWHLAAGKYYKATNQNDKKALFHYLEYYKIQDSIENLEVKKSLLNLEKKFDTKSKELQISNLEIENKKQELLTKEAAFKQRLYLILATAAIILLLIGLWIYLKLQKEKRKLDQANLNLSELNKVKDHLFSILAHDLRGMILPFQRVGKIMKYHIDKKNYTKTLELSSELERNSQNLSNVLNNLLSWSLEQMNSYKINPTNISVIDELQEITEAFKQHASYKNTTIAIDCDITNIVFDKGAFHLIFRNLIGNALKYTENGIVNVTAINRDNNITFTVEDNGIGISPEKAAKIFTLEKEHSTTGTKGEKGTGLGLNLVQRFVQLHQGKINVTPRKPSGTTFHMVFPNYTKI